MQFYLYCRSLMTLTPRIAQAQGDGGSGYESQQPYVTWDCVAIYQVEQYRINWTMGFRRMGYAGSNVLRSSPCPLLVCRWMNVGPFLNI